MKKIITTITLTALLFSCSNGKKEADAFGNFETDEVIISAENNGKVIETKAVEGDVVKAGAILAVTDTINLLLQKQQLEAQKASVEAQKGNIEAQKAVSDQQIANLSKDLARIKKMLQDGAATQKQLDDIEGQIALANKQKNAYNNQLNAIQKQVEAAGSQINIVNDKIRTSSIIAPINGTVLEKYIEIGELATVGKAVYKLANIETLRLKAYVSATQLAEIKIGQKVSVRIDSEDGKEMQGQITWIAAQAEFTPKIIQTKEERIKLVYAIKVDVKNDGSLKIGMPGEVIF